MKKYFTLLILLVSFNLQSQEKPESEPFYGMTIFTTWDAEKYKIEADKALNRLLDDKNYSKERLDNNKNSEIVRKTQIGSSANLRKRQKQQIIQEIEDTYAQEYEKLQKTYEQRKNEIINSRNEWVEYLTIKEAKEKELAEIKKKEKELEEERKRLAEIERQRISDSINKIEYAKRLEAYKSMPTNKEYLSWKSNYESLLASGNRNVSNCERLQNKYSFINAFGQKIYDSSKFSASDKKVFNQNLQNLYNTLQELDTLHENKTFYYYWLDNVPMETSTNAVRLSNFYYNTNRIY
ncbi:MAG: hypothetical protein GW817_09495 [Flavobacteriales bacterium]|nr:hypothetical protein [Flavobacteriales bacterium]NCP84031.1 hypothetical protein [Bacteroidota bacterium]